MSRDLEKSGVNRGGIGWRQHIKTESGTAGKHQMVMKSPLQGCRGEDRPVLKDLGILKTTGIIK